MLCKSNTFTLIIQTEVAFFLFLEGNEAFHVRYCRQIIHTSSSVWKRLIHGDFSDFVEENTGFRRKIDAKTCNTC